MTSKVDLQALLMIFLGGVLAFNILGCREEGDEEEFSEDGSTDTENEDTEEVCGEQGTHTHHVDGECECEQGYEWENEDDPVSCRRIDPDCNPDCHERECGPDPVCDVSCGFCDEDESCTDDGSCVATCDPDCDGIECGQDPVCGESCGDCDVGVCTYNGQCTTIGVDCDPITQEPCLDGEACNLDDALNAVCFEEGSLVEGEPCTYIEDCQAGLICIGGYEGDQFRCQKFCDLEDPFNTTCRPRDQSACILSIGDVGICNLPCDPFGDDCDSDSFCFAMQLEVGGVFFLCEPYPHDDFPTLGEECSAEIGCGPGRTCVSFDGITARCHVLCDDHHDCSGDDCIPYYIDGEAHPDGLGVCRSCFPDCSGIECGLDPVCGTSCGSCSGDDLCLEGECCSPSCGDRECGTEPTCGTSCGSCGYGEVCTASGECCEPHCEGLECGLDPVCGTSCGSCSGGDECTEDGQCECEPSCSYRECGLDPVCGTSCGSCDSGDVCLSGSCCTPSCGSRECGDDPLCGTSCGSCGAGEICESGFCEACVPLLGWCSTTSDCCEVADADIECQYGVCRQCAGSGYDCSAVSCCDGLHCNPASICNDRDCSELGMGCWSNSDCCDTAVCDEDAGSTCQSCRTMWTMCSWDHQCCAGLECDDGMCQ